MSDIGTGATLSIGANWAVSILSISHSGLERESIPSSHLGTTGGRSFIEGDLYDPGELEIEYILDTEDPNADAAKPPYLDVVAAVVVEFPIFPGSGDGTGSKMSGNGFVTSVSPYTLDLEGLVVGSLTIKLTGAITWINATA